MHSVWRRIHRYRGMLVIVLLQAPAPVQRDESGRVTLGLGFGSSRVDELAYHGGTPLGCDGTPIGPIQDEETKLHHFKPRSVGGLVGARFKKLRGTIVYNHTSADTVSLSGGRLGWLVAREGTNIGFGAGAYIGDGQVTPGIYLRFGPENKLNGLVEFPASSTPLANTGAGRVGLAWNTTGTGLGAFVGRGVCHINCDYNDEGWRADAHVPINSRFRIDLSGLLSERRQELTHNEHDVLWGFSAALRVTP